MQKITKQHKGRDETQISRYTPVSEYPTALIVSLVSSDHVAKCFGSIPVMPICGQVLAALLRPIFYRETVQGPVWALPAARQEGSLEFLVSVSGHWSQALWRLQGHYL